MTRLVYIVGHTNPRPAIEPTCRIDHVPWQWFINRRPRNFPQHTRHKEF